jgi:hypothetical protein
MRQSSGEDDVSAWKNTCRAHPDPSFQLLTCTQGSIHVPPRSSTTCTFDTQSIESENLSQQYPSICLDLVPPRHTSVQAEMWTYLHRWVSQHDGRAYSFHLMHELGKRIRRVRSSEDTLGADGREIHNRRVDAVGRDNYDGCLLGHAETVQTTSKALDEVQCLGSGDGPGGVLGVDPQWSTVFDLAIWEEKAEKIALWYVNGW